MDPNIVMVVEDEECCATMLEIALLTVPGIEVRVVHSAGDALNLLETVDPGISLLVTDLHLPLMDGFELIERLRRSGNPADIPIVVISGDSDPSTAERVSRLGANAYFCKPYSVRQLCQTVERLLAEDSISVLVPGESNRPPHFNES